MSTRYYVDASGRYIGGFAETEVNGEVFKASAPAGAIEVVEPPQHAQQPWLGDRWGDVPEEES